MDVLLSKKWAEGNLGVSRAMAFIRRLTSNMIRVKLR